MRKGHVLSLWLVGDGPHQALRSKANSLVLVVNRQAKPWKYVHAEDGIRLVPGQIDNVAAIVSIREPRRNPRRIVRLTRRILPNALTVEVVQQRQLESLRGSGVDETGAGSRVEHDLELVAAVRKELLQS